MRVRLSILTTMLVLESLLQVLVRLPKLFIAIAKRYSSTTRRLWRYFLSFYNSLIQKQKRKHLPENDADRGPTSTERVDSEGDVREGDSIAGSATIRYSQYEDSVPARVPTLLASHTPAARPTDGGAPNLGAMQSSLSSDTNPRSSNRDHYPPAQTDSNCMHCCRPPIRHPHFTGNLSGLIYMLMFLDYPGFIERSIKATQHHHATNVAEWKEFWKTFQSEVGNINVLATMLVAGNANFLSITSQHGLSYLPQQLCYISLVAALGSIWMGLAVRIPRFFTAYSEVYLRVMVMVLGIPFELFLYSTILFIAALITHLSINEAMLQIYGGAVIMGLVIVCLFLYWLVTEPLDGWQFLPQECKTHRTEASSQTV
ncbi:hypothetical protein EDC04DRAFT_872782 [Pisolithus marmoratus]|nr:hypothetical protein EDC04DRAFT_872782 [Pisolithus marmoratus]